MNAKTPWGAPPTVVDVVVVPVVDVVVVPVVDVVVVPVVDVVVVPVVDVVVVVVVVVGSVVVVVVVGSVVVVVVVGSVVVVVVGSVVVVVVVGAAWQPAASQPPEPRAICAAGSVPLGPWQPSHASAVVFIAGALVWQVPQGMLMVDRW